jgi:peptidoglycan/LPS O-acetylase OafA/YrhL
VSESYVRRFFLIVPAVFAYLAAVVGRISDSLYLWQQPFLNPRTGTWFARYPQNLALTLVAATASYHLIEKPLLRAIGAVRRSVAAPSTASAACWSWRRR